MNSDLFFDLKNPKLTAHRSPLTAPRSQNSFVPLVTTIWLFIPCVVFVGLALPVLGVFGNPLLVLDVLGGFFHVFCDFGIPLLVLLLLVICLCLLVQNFNTYTKTHFGNGAGYQYITTKMVSNHQTWGQVEVEKSFCWWQHHRKMMRKPKHQKAIRAMQDDII